MNVTFRKHAAERGSKVRPGKFLECTSVQISLGSASRVAVEEDPVWHEHQNHEKLCSKLLYWGWL